MLFCFHSWFRFSLVNFLCHNLAYLQQNLKLILDKPSESRLDKCCQKMKHLLQNIRKCDYIICATKFESLLLFSGGSSGGQAFKNNRAISVQASIFLYFVFSSQNVLLESCQNRTILARRVFLFTDLIANKTLSQCWRLNLSNF